MKSVSFDFDDTLDNNKVQDYAKSLIEKGIDVHIVTSRYENPTMYPNNRDGHLNNDDLFKTASKIGIDNSKIHFTNMLDKAEWFILYPEYQFIWHLDNSWQEINEINNSTTIIGIDYIKSNWKEKCNKLLQNE